MGILLFLFVLGMAFCVNDYARKNNIGFVTAAITLYKQYKQPVQQEPVPDIALNENIMSVLRPYNLLPPEQVITQISKNYGFFTMNYDMVMRDFSNLPLVEAMAKKAAFNYLNQYCPNPAVYIYSEKYDAHSLYIIVCYAIFDDAKKALKEFVDLRNNAQKQAVMQSVATTVDNELEADLAKL